ncbi:unnamed protein product [Phytomonas sp. Hart1]|nr:unnamed protein product [Phytomonas sp. Hart1]|eukprot:CCW69329.1 unnamed protein product [Phytomonas sp. isolate Hart1]
MPSSFHWVIDESDTDGAQTTIVLNLNARDTRGNDFTERGGVAPFFTSSGTFMETAGDWDLFNDVDSFPSAPPSEGGSTSSRSLSRKSSFATPTRRGSRLSRQRRLRGHNPRDLSPPLSYGEVGTLRGRGRRSFRYVVDEDGEPVGDLKDGRGGNDVRPSGAPFSIPKSTFGGAFIRALELRLAGGFAAPMGASHLSQTTLSESGPSTIWGDAEGDLRERMLPKRNKKLNKKKISEEKKWQRVFSTTRNRDGNPSASDIKRDRSFSEMVGVLVARARQQRHHLPDYDSEEEDNKKEDALDGEYSSLGSDHTNPRDAPNRPHHRSKKPKPWRGGIASSPPQQDAHEGASFLGSSFLPFVEDAVGDPAKPPDPSAFFISPIHQCVAQESAPWGGASAGPSSGLGTPSFVQFLGCGGLPAHAAPPQNRPRAPHGALHRSSPGATAGRPAVQRRRPPSDRPERYCRELQKVAELEGERLLDRALKPNERDPRRKAGDDADDMVCVEGVIPLPLGGGARPGVARRRRASGRSARDGVPSSGTLPPPCGDVDLFCSALWGKRSRQDRRAPLNTGNDGWTSSSSESENENEVRPRANKFRRLNGRSQGMNGSIESRALGPSPSPSLALFPPLPMLPASKAEMLEDFVFTPYVGERIEEDDFQLF